MKKSTSWAAVSALLGGFLIQLTFGAFYAFGNIMTYMTSYMRAYVDHDMTYTNFIVVQSVWGIAQGCVFPMAGIFIRRFGEPACVLLGTSLFAISNALTAYTINLSLAAVAFTYGFVAALGQCIALIPTLTIGMRHFPGHRGKAMGIVVGGFGGGALLFINIQTWLINPENLALDDSVCDARLHSADGISTACQERYFTDPDLLYRVPRSLLVLGAIIAAMGLTGCLLLVLPQVCLSEMSTSDLDHEESISIQNLAQTEVHRSPASGDLAVGDALGSVEFVLLWLTRLLVVAISQSVAGFYKAYGQTLISDDDHFLSLIGSLAAVCNCSGRFIYGTIMDYFSYRTAMLLESVILCSLLASYPLVGFINELNVLAIKAAYAILTCAIFITFPGTYATQPAVTVQTFGQTNGGAIYGLIFTTDIFNNLLISTFAKPLVDAAGYEGLWLSFAAIAIVVTLINLQYPTRANPDSVRPIECVRRVAKRLTLAYTCITARTRTTERDAL